MKITKFLTFATALGVLFTSCNKDEVNGEFPSVPGVAGTGMISLYVADAVSTRAIEEGNADGGNTAERKINTLEIFVYDAQDTTTPEVYKKYVAEEGEELGTLYNIGVDVPEGQTTADKKVLVFTNRATTGDLESISYANLLKAEYNSSIATPTAIPASGIPMAGENVVTAEVEVVTPVVVNISRLFAKFNAPTDENASVELTEESRQELADMYEVSVSEVQATGTFSLNRYYVINGMKLSYMYPNYGVGEEADRWNIENAWLIGGNLDNYTASVYNTDSTMRSAYSGTNYLTNSAVYLYENSPKYTEGYGFAPGSVYSFIIEADLTVTVANETKELTRYWRINVSKHDGITNYFKILRNAIYNVDIEMVKTIGYGTPKEAEEGENPIPGPGDAVIKVKVELLPWRVFNEGATI